MSKCGVFSGPYFPALGLNTERYYGPEITPYLDTFHAVGSPSKPCWFRGRLYGSRYIGQRIYRLTDITFSMYLYERTKVISRFSWDFTWALFFHKQQDKKTMKYTKNVLHEGLKLKGLILFAAIYQIGDAAYPPCFREYSTCSSNAEAVYNNWMNWMNWIWVIKSSLGVLETYHCLATRKCSSSNFLLLCFT